MAENDKIIPLEAFGLKLMSMGFLVSPEQAMIWRGPMLHSAIRQFLTDVEWGSLDYMVIDLPPGTGDAQLTLAQSVPLTGAVVVMTSQDVAVNIASKAVGMFRSLKVPILGVVGNMDSFACPHCGEPEVEVWCYQTRVRCHHCGRWLAHTPPSCRGTSAICRLAIELEAQEAGEAD